MRVKLTGANKYNKAYSLTLINAKATNNKLRVGSKARGGLQIDIIPRLDVNNRHKYAVR